MPAFSHMPVSLHVNSRGRRLTSLKGGNRVARSHAKGGMVCYGDLSCDFLVRAGNAARYRDIHGPLMYWLQPNDSWFAVHAECKRAHIDAIDRTELLPELADSCREYVMEGWWWRQS